MARKLTLEPLRVDSKCTVQLYLCQCDPLLPKCGLEKVLWIAEYVLLVGFFFSFLWCNISLSSVSLTNWRISKYLKFYFTTIFTSGISSQTNHWKQTQLPSHSRPSISAATSVDSDSKAASVVVRQQGQQRHLVWKLKCHRNYGWMGQKRVSHRMKF